MRVNRKIFFGIVLFLFVYLPVETLPAKSYTLQQIQVYAVIQPDGSMAVTESRTYNFRGRFSWADYRLPISGFGEVQQFTLSDKYGNYIPKNNEQAGSYITEYTDSEFYVRWFYEANNETRTFQLNYILTDVITVYSDIAELYFQFVGRRNNQRVENVTVIIQLPQPAAFPEVRAWVHGPLWGDVSFRNGQIVTNVSPLPARRFWEARVVFPPSWVSDATKTRDEKHLDNVLEEEKAWAEQANRQREEARIHMAREQENRSRAWLFSIILTIAGALGLIFLYLRYGRERKVDFSEKITSEVPSDEPPAITSALFFNKQVYGSAITATIFDLARRGTIHVVQTSMPVKKWWGTVPPDIQLQRTTPDHKSKPLLDYERDLLEFIFEELGQGNESVNLKLFKKNRSKVQRWFNKWKNLVKEHISGVPYYDRSSIRGTVYAVVLSVLVIGGGFLILYLLGKPGILAMFAGVVLLGFSFTILSYTPEINLKRKKLSALKKYLKKYYFLERTGEEQQTGNIDLFLVYGIALGLGKKDIEKMMMSIPPEKQGVIFPWYIYPSGGFATPADFAAAVSSMAQVAASTVSSSAGAGGGASGGGGGGGGGASGGAG